MKLTRPLFANSATGKVGEIGHIRAAQTGFFFVKTRQMSARFTVASQANRDFFTTQYAAFRAAGYRLNTSWVYWLRQATAATPVNHGNLATGSVLNSIRARAPTPVARGNLATGRILESIRK